MSATVGIVMRTRDRPILLRRAIQSVLSQTFGDWHLVIVNDAGDGSIVDNLTTEFATKARGRISVLHREESTGMEAASNAGIRSLDTSYLVIHDDDDSWEPEFLEKAVDFLKNRPMPEIRGVVSHSQWIVEKIEDEKIEQIREAPFNATLESVRYYEMLEINTFPPISFLFEKAVWEELTGYDESLPVLGDWDFNLRFLRCYEIGVIPETLAHYHHREKNAEGAYGNTVVSGHQKHVLIDTMLRNRWLREDLETGRMGQGYLANIARSQDRNRKLAEQNSRSLADQLQGTYDQLNRQLGAVDGAQQGLSRQLQGSYDSLTQQTKASQEYLNVIDQAQQHLSKQVQGSYDSLQQQTNDATTRVERKVDGMHEHLSGYLTVFRSDLFQYIQQVQKKIERKIRKKKFWHLFFKGP